MQCGHGLSRRTFLTRAIAAGIGASVPVSLLTEGCGPAILSGNLVTAHGNSLLPGGMPLPGRSPTSAEAAVAAVKGQVLGDMTRRVLADLGGISTVVLPGETVFIKPNFLTAGLQRTEYTTTGEITKAEIVTATAEECLKAGAAKVIIGDGAQVREFDFASLTTIDGATDLAAEAVRLNAEYGDRVQLACLNRDSPSWVPVSSQRTNLDNILVSSLVARADKLISIAVLKTHHFAHLSLSMKNLFGVTPIKQYGGGTERVGRYHLHNALGGPEGVFLDLVDALQPDLAIVDASICCEGQGPWVRPGAGHTVDVRDRLGDWLILASTDCVAADVTAARIVGQDYMDIPYLVSAYEQGLGQAQADSITLIGPTVDDLRMDWEPAQVII